MNRNPLSCHVEVRPYKGHRKQSSEQSTTKLTLKKQTLGSRYWSRHKARFSFSLIKKNNSDLATLFKKFTNSHTLLINWRINYSIQRLAAKFLTPLILLRSSIS